MAYLPVGARVQQLHLVGFTTDQKQLILSARKGAKSGGFMIALDERLVGLIDEVLRREETDGGDRLEQHRRFARQESQLSPREIQARVRSGSSLSRVARDAGVDEDWVARFAAPILAEQAQVVDRARELRYATPRKGLSAQPLGTAVRWNVAARGVRLGDQTFDAGWGALQLIDGSWVVRFAFVSRQRPQVAEWEIDFSDGTVTARNRLASNLGYIPPRTKAPRAELLSADTPPAPPVEAEAADSPARPQARKQAARKVGTQKRAAKKVAGKKVAGKRAASKKVAGKKAASKKVAGKKRAAKKVAAGKVPGKRSAAQKGAVKKRASKKVAGKKAASKKRAGSQSAARKKAVPAARRRPATRPRAKSQAPAKRVAAKKGSRPGRTAAVGKAPKKTTRAKKAKKAKKPGSAKSTATRRPAARQARTDLPDARASATSAWAPEVPREPRSRRRARARQAQELRREAPASPQPSPVPRPPQPTVPADVPSPPSVAAPAVASAPSAGPNRVVTIRADRATPPTESQLGRLRRRRESNSRR